MAPTTPIARALQSWPANPPVFDVLGAPAGDPPPTGERTDPADPPDARSEQRSFLSAVATAPESIASLIEVLTGCGVRALRHDSPDLLAQLHLLLRRPVDAVVCSVMDIDPSACVNCAVAATESADVLAGLMAIARASGAKRRALVLDLRAPRSWHSALRQAARSQGAKVIELDNVYPQSDPTLLIYTLTNRRLRPGGLPPEQGVMLLDAAAAAAVGAAVRRGSRMTHHPIALRDHDRAETYFLRAGCEERVAGAFERVALELHGRDGPALFRAGDVLRDVRVSPDAVIGAGELVWHAWRRPPLAVNPESCIRCGWCFDACPTGVAPAEVLGAAQRGDRNLAERAGLRACIECGICTYVCPSRLPLLGAVRTVRLTPRPELDGAAPVSEHPGKHGGT